jgi:hypothetical protein
MCYIRIRNPSDAIIFSQREEKAKKKGRKRKAREKRVKYLVKGQTWQLCGKVSLKRRLWKRSERFRVKFASHLKKTDQNEKNVSRLSPAPSKQNKGAVLLFPLQF